MRKSAGLLVYKKDKDVIKFFLVHPGGPFWKGKEKGAWSIPKGEYAADEDPLTAATREFKEETGYSISGAFFALKSIRQKSGKIVEAWAIAGDVDADKIVSNVFQLEYPYKSGKFINVPEVDKAGWFDYAEACELINPAQKGFLDEVLNIQSE